MKALTTLLSDSNDLLIVAQDQVDEWFGDVPDDSTITIEVNGIKATGVKSPAALTLIADTPIVAPKGSCITYTWEPTADCGDDDESAVCLPTEVTELLETTKLAVLDDKSCPTGYITLADLMKFLSENQEPTPLCEMVSASPEQPTADMMVLGLTDGCTLIKVPATAFDCTSTDPEGFNCG